MVIKAQEPHLDANIHLRHRVTQHNPHLGCSEAAVTSQPHHKQFSTDGSCCNAHSDNEVNIFTHKLTGALVLPAKYNATVHFINRTFSLFSQEGLNLVFMHWE